MVWTSIRVKKETAKDLKDSISAENDDKRIQKLLSERTEFLTRTEVKDLIDRKISLLTNNH